MDKTQKTADYFRDKSDEEIIDWMIKNLSTEQIRSCLGDDIPDVIKPVPKGQMDVTTLRKYCANKPYLIQKIENETVFYWYFNFKLKRWMYYNDPIDKFPSEEGGFAEECNPDSEMKKEVSETLDNLFLAFDYQLNTSFDKKSNLSKIMKYVPVLIESSTDETITYYYLTYKIIDGNLNMSLLIEEELNIKECATEFEEIKSYWDKLDDKIIEDGTAGPSDTFTISEVSEKIKKTIIDKLSESKYKDDLLNIKANYEAISKLEDTYFIAGLYPIENKFGSVKNYNTLDEYVENFYGKTFSKLFKPYIVENKFGLKTIHYSLR